MKISELLKSRSIIEIIINQYTDDSWAYINEAKNLPLQKTPRQIIFRTGKDFENTYSKIAARPSAVSKYEAFKHLKSNPETLMTPLGSSDKLFAPESPLGRAVPSLRHIHITHDISLVYRIHGVNPTYVDLYGFYSHDDLGTAPGGGSKPKTISKMAANFYKDTMV